MILENKIYLVVFIFRGDGIFSHIYLLVHKGENSTTVYVAEKNGAVVVYINPDEMKDWKYYLLKKKKQL